MKVGTGSTGVRTYSYLTPSPSIVLLSFSNCFFFFQGSIGDVNAILHERGCYSNDARDLATLVVELKKKLGETRKAKALLERQISEATGKRDEERKKIRTLSVQVIIRNAAIQEILKLQFGKKINYQFYSIKLIF